MQNLNQLLDFDPDYPTPYCPNLERVDNADVMFAKDLTYREEVRARARSVIELMQHGMQVDDTRDTEYLANELFKENKPLVEHKTKPDVILRLEALLSEYDHDVVQESVQIRRYVTNKLIDEAENAPKASERIKALELLGKMGDVGLFVERSIITIEHKSTEELNAELEKTLTLLLDPTTNTYEADMTLITPPVQPQFPVHKPSFKDIVVPKKA